MLTSTLSCYALIFLAEIGDKSQLVCMLLASRYRRLPIFLGASTAFSILNILAITLGSILAGLIPQNIMAALVITMFSIFGLKSLLERMGEEDDISEKSGHSVFITTFMMIFVAEFGDKTQLTVAALGASSDPVAIYIGATTALITTTLLGVMGGKWLTKFVSPLTLHRVSGVLFLTFAAWISINTFL